MTPLLKVAVPTCPEVDTWVVAPVNTYAIEEPEQLSVNKASVTATEAVHTPVLLDTTIAEVGVTVGNSVSFTVTVVDPVWIFPTASVTV